MQKKIDAPDTINLSEVLSLIMLAISERCATFSHIDMSRCLVCVSSNRNGRGGVFGKVVPLRFENGEKALMYREKCYAMPQLIRDGNEILYVIYFYMPKFFDLTARDKLNVIFHELYHISADFNGDIRRMGKVRIAHGHSKKRYGSAYEAELEEFYSYISGTPLINFLRMSRRDLYINFSSVTATRMKAPRPVIVDMNGKAVSV